MNWDEFLNNHHKIDVRSKDVIKHYVDKSLAAYDKKDYGFFLENMPYNLHWRAFPDIKNCCFLDIETTGLDKYNDSITLIGVYDGSQSKIFVNGQNMDQFESEISKYDMIVSFNGRCFDVPFIQAKFPSVDLNKFHCDLRFAMRAIGYAGGLKRIEKEVGLVRDDDLQDIDGWEAVRLWYKYKRGDDSALELLKKYNQADIENLKVLMEFTFDKLRDQEFLSLL